MSLISPLFDPTSSSSALAPLYFSMVKTLFVVVVNNLSAAGSWFVVPLDITQGTLTQGRSAQTTGGDCTPAASSAEQRGIEGEGGGEEDGVQDHIAS
jgi:hypothetical protein